MPMACCAAGAVSAALNPANSSLSRPTNADWIAYAWANVVSGSAAVMLGKVVGSLAAASSFSGQPLTV